MANVAYDVDNPTTEDIIVIDTRGFGNAVLKVAAGATDLDMLTLADAKALAHSDHWARLTAASGPLTVNKTFDDQNNADAPGEAGAYDIT